MADDLIESRKKKLEELKRLKINPYPYSYDAKNSSVEILEKYANLANEQKTEDKVSIAGRIMTFRDIGKVTFMHVQDQNGQIQIYFQADAMKDYGLIKSLDLGDIIGVKGTVFKTKRGEITVFVKEFDVLAKCLRPLPEKYHGLQDTELRHRYRYLDFISNEQSRKNMILRSRIINEIRNYMNKKGFIEVETPILQQVYGGAAAKPFKTRHNALNTDLFLRISPEIYLKKMIIGGFERVYEIGKNFRNEGIDHQHNPEFTMIEAYQAYADYNDMMKLTEDLIRTAAKKALGATRIVVGEGRAIDLEVKFKRMTMKQALKEYVNIDVDKYSEDQLKDLVRTYNLEYHGDLTYGGVMAVLFEELVEDKLIEPTFITDYPIEVCPLTKKHRKDHRLTERFELFINGIEIANAYSELNDPVDQFERLKKQEEQRFADEQGEFHPMDKDFVKAMEYGMPPTGGVGIGIDRLIILLTGNNSIREIISFPAMKPKED